MMIEQSIIRENMAGVVCSAFDDSVCACEIQFSSSWISILNFMDIQINPTAERRRGVLHDAEIHMEGSQA